MVPKVTSKALYSFMLALADTADVKRALPPVAEYYYGPDVLDSVGEDCAVLKLDYDIWGYGLVEEVCQCIRYAEYDPATGRVTWFDAGETLEGVETPGLGTP